MALKYGTRILSDIPGPPKIPLWGNLYLYKLGVYNILQYHKVLKELYKTYGPLVQQNLGQKTFINVFDPDDIQIVYRNEGESPNVVPLLDTAKLYREKNDMSPGLGNINGEEWYRMRSAIRKMMLRPLEVSYYLPFIQDVAQDFVNRISQKCNSEGEISDLQSEVAKWSMESAGLICFEKRLGCLSGGQRESWCKQMVSANKKIFELSAFLKFSLPIYNYIPTPKWKNLTKAEDFFYKNALKLISDTIEEIEKTTHNMEMNKKYNFMAYLLSRKELSKRDIIIITFSMFTDGLSTTVPALLYNLYCLATNNEVQEKLHQEIFSVIGNDWKITTDILNNLPYLKAVVKETFRFFPIGTEVSRIIPIDLVLSGYEIPAGVCVDLCPQVHFQSEKYFKDPHIFQPERWIQTSKEKSIHPYLLTPFGHGTRTCAGRRFAEQDLYIVLCYILLKFKLQYTGSKALQQVYNTLLFPDGPVKIKFIPRV